MRVVGLDLSLTATGYATDGETRVVRVPLVPNATERERVIRLRGMAHVIDRLCREADVVVMEGYSHDSKFQGPQLGELGGVVKVCLLQRGVPFVSIPPKRVKKYATDNGNANKDQMLAAAVRQNPEISNNNEADAYHLWLMGLAHYLNQDFVLPEYKRAVLESIEWPSIETKEEAVG